MQTNSNASAIRIAIFLVLSAVILSVSCATSSGTGKLSKELSASGESAVFSFATTDGRVASLNIGPDESYIVFRLGNASKIDMEFPKPDEFSWEEFSYEWYLRGGGPENEGEDLNSVFFKNEGFDYELFENYAAGDADNPESTELGINITDTKTKKITHIVGRIESQKGTLQVFRDSEKIRHGHE